MVFEPGSALMLDRAARLARELDLNFYILSCGQEWRRPDLAKDVGAPFIVPLDFPELPKMPEEQDWEQVSLDQLRAWDWAPEDAALLRQQGLDLALTTYGLSDKKKFRQNLRLAMDRRNWRFALVLLLLTAGATFTAWSRVSKDQGSVLQRLLFAPAQVLLHEQRGDLGAHLLR